MNATKSNYVNPEDLKIGDELPGFTFGPINSGHLIKWIVASEDFNPIHYDKDFAVSQGLPGVLMQGPFKLSLIESHLRKLFGQNSRLENIACTYRDPDPVGNTLTLRLKIAGKSLTNGIYTLILELQVENNKKTISVDGKALLAVDARS